MTAPKVLLSLFGLPPPDKPWIRVVGMLTFLLGCYYVQCARAELRRFFELTVGARFAAPICSATLGQLVSQDGHYSDRRNLSKPRLIELLIASYNEINDSSELLAPRAPKLACRGRMA